MTEGWVAKRNKLVEEAQAAKAKARTEERARKLAGEGESPDLGAQEDAGFEQWMTDGGSEHDVEIGLTEEQLAQIPDFTSPGGFMPFPPLMDPQPPHIPAGLLDLLGKLKGEPVVDEVNHPPHYKSPASCSQCGHEIQCIDVTRHMNFTLGNAVKYIWRVAFGGKRGQDPVKDLEKSSWYVRDEINARVIQEIED